MKKLLAFWFALTFGVLLFWVCILPVQGGELEDLFAEVQALNIERQGYVLCCELTSAQQAFARDHLEKANASKVYKLRDKSLNIVADRTTHRVLVMYEQFEQVDQARVQTLVGDLFLSYEDPTLSAHDKVVYWAWGKKGKFTADQFNLAREKKKSLAIVATVKLNSEIKIMDKAFAHDKGDVYYIISSDPLLAFFTDP
ncbi:MAG: hypothetical protein HUK40_09220 [Desulfobacter sp.]|nr:hypothetical protein [Desulfobacter sp.]WDP84847.1 MAG: hypothetical protein HUN05_06525 [Desulfobacter sp.]